MNAITKLALFVPALLGTAACATTMDDDGRMPSRDIAGECDADDAQSMLGERATAATGAQLLRLTGATELRWVPPRTAVTMDFRANRLTVSYDDNMIIERIACG